MKVYKTIELERKEDDSLVLIYLNRPSARNAMNYEMVSELCQCLNSLFDNNDIGCLILSGKGETFSVGGDIKEFIIANDLVNYMAKLVSKLHEGIELIKSFEIPIIAAINGACFGAALGYVCACDLRFCIEKSSFGAAFTGIGLSPDSSTSFYLPKLVGLSLANEMILLNRILTSEEAEKNRLINGIIKEESFLSEILKIGSHLARAPLNALKRSKKLIKNSYSNRLHEHLIEEAKYIKECAGTLDFKEGISAFVEKRYPSFKNK